jgi:ornithine cyclodeaminase/alanine dehydrogenase-like protein (mu-crystallin family)
MRRNRFVINTTAVSTGRLAAVHISGTLGSNGRGSARLRLLGNSTDSDTGELLEECEREVTIQMRRGPR